MDDDSPSTSSSTTAQHQANGSYCTHKVTKRDTLAGIAVKYNVSVADIKRSNGLLSDTAMFAKDYLLIPSRSIPLGQEYATIAGMIVTQFGRPVPLPAQSGELDHRGSHVSSALDALRGYYGLGSASPSGPGPDYFRGHSDDERLHLRGRALSDVGRSDSGEVEMTEFERPGLPRHPSASGLDEQAGTRAGYQIDERLRRRNTDTSPAQRASGLEGDICLEGTSDQFTGDSQDSQPLQHSRSVGRPPTSSRLAQPRQSQPGSNTRQKETLFQRIKRAASQPALAGPSAPPVTQAAQSATASVSNITQSDSSFSTAQRVSSIVQSTRGKESKKD